MPFRGWASLGQVLKDLPRNALVIWCDRAIIIPQASGPDLCWAERQLKLVRGSFLRIRVMDPFTQNGSHVGIMLRTVPLQQDCVRLFTRVMVSR